MVSELVSVPVQHNNNNNNNNNSNTHLMPHLGCASVVALLSPTVEEVL